MRNEKLDTKVVAPTLRVGMLIEMSTYQKRCDPDSSKGVSPEIFVARNMNS